ncbi:MAG: nucleotide-binding protein [Methylococcaceae bacterium]
MTHKYFGNNELEKIPTDVWNGIVTVYKRFIANNSLAEYFPEQCQDGHGICGCDSRSLEFAIKAIVPDLEIPICEIIEISAHELNRYPPNLREDKKSKKLLPDIFTVLRFIEFLYERIKDPFEIGKYHDHYHHFHYLFRDNGLQKSEFRNAINQIFSSNKISLYLDNDGVVKTHDESKKTQPIIQKITENRMSQQFFDKTKIFIVHGKDELAKTEVARFVEQIGLKAIILHEQASGGKTIIEKIEANTDVGFAIVLYTPCDEGNLAGENPKPRSRQNVVFEHGYLIGKLERKNVCALVKGDVEKPNDISGVVYTNYDDKGAWKMELAKELREAGYEIDMNKIL